LCEFKPNIRNVFHGELDLSLVRRNEEGSDFLACAFGKWIKEVFETTEIDELLTK